jgi:hypothetical protein
MTITRPEPASTNKVEPKVAWASIGTYIAGVVLLALVNALDENTTLLTDAIPDMFEPFLLPLVPALVALVSGFAARHQWRAAPRADGSTTVG